MSFLPSWLLGGVNLDEEQAKQDAIDSQLGALNKKNLDSGVYDDATYAEAEAHRLAGKLDVNQEVADVFNKSINDSVSGAAGAVKGVIKTPFDFLFQALPWEIWVIAAGVAFFYLGGFTYLRGILAKR